MIKKVKHKDGYWVYFDDEASPDCRYEVSEQIDAMAWVKEFYPHARPLTFHVPNESDAKRSARYQQDLIQQGVTKGVSDIVTLHGYGGAFEMKREHKSKSAVSKEQRAFLSGAARERHFAALCYGAEAFKHAWRDYIDSLYPF